MPLEQNEKSPIRDYKYAEVQNEDKELGHCDPKKNYSREYITTIIATLGTIVCGIQFTWMGPILPQMLSGSFKIQITMAESVWVFNLLHVGGLIGSIVASMITNHFGRKRTIVWTTIPFIISSIIRIYAETVLHYYIAQFIGGFSVGASFAVVSMYISEISSPEIRGILSTFIHFSVSVGILFVFVLGACLPIITYYYVLAIFPIIQLIFTFYLPETPYFQVMKQDYKGAEKTLRYIRKKSNVQDELNRLIEGYKEEVSEKDQTFLDLFRDRTNLKSIIIITVLTMAQQWTGATAIYGYSQVIFVDGHSSISAESCGILLALMNFAVVFLLGAVIDRFGRRVLLMVSGIVTLIPLTMLGVYFYLQDFTDFKYIEHFRLVPLIGIVFFKFSYGVGLSGIPYVLSGELFPTTVKAYASSLNSITMTAIGIVANNMYEIAFKEYNYPGVFAMFFILLVLAIIFIYFMVPETKGLTLEEIQVKLRKSNKNKIRKISN
ncbi:facilitated trehalose transporter Tret1-like [Chrysoperla carnea]|uniref:facilitated trehalose transporter Tret1-like n=1 Tax=Chrysoperla carnea TaxID=189513 RepID=UPI001D0664D7|nr:facilitated trehalose transporter Tret1-like [Chrysoperla carnea]